MSETHGVPMRLSFGHLMPWIITAVSVVSMIYTVSSFMTAIRLEQSSHDRRITRIEANMSAQQELLYSINNQVATLNQRFIDEFGKQSGK